MSWAIIAAHSLFKGDFRTKREAEAMLKYWATFPTYGEHYFEEYRIVPWEDLHAPSCAHEGRDVKRRGQAPIRAFGMT